VVENISLTGMLDANTFSRVGYVPGTAHWSLPELPEGNVAVLRLNNRKDILVSCCGVRLIRDAAGRQAKVGGGMVPVNSAGSAVREIFSGSVGARHSS